MSSVQHNASRNEFMANVVSIVLNSEAFGGFLKYLLS